MKIPLIMSLLVLISCANKEQALIPNKKPLLQSEETIVQETEVAPKIAEEFTYKSFLTIPHTENKTSLRNQLINNLTESSLQKKSLEIKDRIELDSTPMSVNELGRYSENEMTFAKIVVSMTNGSEVFFVPENISLKTIITKIGLIPEQDRKLKWLEVSESTLTEAGKNYYLLSVNHDDLISNDLIFYSHQINLNNRFTNQALSFSRGTRLEIDVTHKFFKESVKEQSVARDADCRYLKTVGAGEYVQIESQSISQLGFVIAKNKNWVAVTDSNAERLNNTTFRLHLHPEAGLDKEFSLEFSQATTATIEESFPLKQVPAACGFGFKKVSTENLKTKAEFDILIKVFGRGEKLKEIKI